MKLSGVQAEQTDTILQSLQQLGYQPRTVTEPPAGMNDLLVLPVPQKLDEKTLAALKTSVGRGNRLVLVAQDGYPDASVNRLFQLVGMRLAGTVFVSQPMGFYWKGNRQEAGERLPSGNRILSVPLNPVLDVLATWDRDYPAIIASGKGALINWQLGRQLSGHTNRKALQTVMQYYGYKPVQMAQASVETTPASSTKSATDVRPVPSERPQPVSPVISRTSDVPEEQSGGDLSGGDLKEELERAATGEEAPKKQKHFSFLDASAEDLAPEFDYGVYSRNMRVWDDYNHRVDDALEASRQLSIELPEKKIQALRDQSRAHRRKFEELYLGNKTDEGLQEFQEAKKYMLQALSLTSLSPKTEGRAIWLDRGTIVDSANPAGMKKLMHKLHDAGINVVFFETVNAGFPVYPSKLVDQNPLTKGWDPLEVAIEEGHRLGMEVHAWVWVFAVGNKRHNDVINLPSSYVGPILSKPEMKDEALLGASGNYQPDYKQHEFWLSPASPKGREFLLDLYAEIVRNYDVDGLHLDYIRYPFQSSSTGMGYEPVGRTAFFNATGTSLDELDDYKRKLWIAWKTYQVSSFVQQVSTRMRSLRPDIRISAAVFPMRRESRIIAIQQDWETWIDNGWIDILTPMSYTSEPSELQSIYSYVASSPQKHALIYPGIAIRNLDAGELSMHLDAIRRKGSLGATLFAGAHLDEMKAMALGTGPFKEKQSIPPHRDPVKALEALLDDLDEKFGNVVHNQPTAVPADMKSGIQQEIQRMRTVLASLGKSRPGLEEIKKAQADFGSLKTALSRWLDMDRPTHAYRAQYFDQTMLLMDRLVGYMYDKISWNQPSLAAPPADTHAAAAP